MYLLIKKIIPAVGLTLASTALFAAEINNGVWFGQGSGSQFLCSDSRFQVPIKADFDVSFDRQNSEQYQITVSARDPFGTTSMSGIANFIDDNHLVGNLAGTRDNGEAINFEFTGVSLGSDLVYFNGAGVNEVCQYSFGGGLSQKGDLPDVDEVALIPEFSGGSRVINDAATLQNQIMSTTEIIRKRIHDIYSPHLTRKSMTASNQGFSLNTGLAAGDGGLEIGVWTNYNHIRFENDFILTKYDGDTDQFLMGVDLQPFDHFIMGVALSYERTTIDTDFNKGESKSAGYSITPYAAYLINQQFSVDINGGYSDISYDQFRILPNGTKVNGDTDGQRGFISANLNGSWDLTKEFLFTGNVGGFAAANDDDSYVDSSGKKEIRHFTYVSGFNLGGELAYYIADFEPYLNLQFNHVMSRSSNKIAGIVDPTDDRNNMLGAIGIRYYGAQGLSFSAEYSQRFKQKNIDEDSLSLMLRWDL